MTTTSATPTTLAARLLAGGVYTGFGLAKIGDVEGTIRSVRAYRLLPEAVVPTVGTALPAVEVAVGVLLLLGLLTRPAAVVTAVLSTCFVIGIATAWARGLSIECGCFGNGGSTNHPVPGYVRELLVNAGALACCGWLLARSAGRFSLDSALGLAGHPPTTKENA
jgi:uncharacterized membrane protein YphA (DoxX/SURF4 family)